MTAATTPEEGEAPVQNMGFGTYGYRTYVLSALTLIYILNFVDRGLLAVVGPRTLLDRLDFDGLAGGPGRAFDIALKGIYELGSGWRIGAGYRMLEGIRFLRPALDIVLHHQERYDGTGYPRGLRGEAIPLGSRLIALADVTGKFGLGREDYAAALLDSVENPAHIRRRVTVTSARDPVR